MVDPNHCVWKSLGTVDETVCTGSGCKLLGGVAKPPNIVEAPAFIPNVAGPGDGGNACAGAGVAVVIAAAVEERLVMPGISERCIACCPRACNRKW